jgi:DNA-binding transcriptional MerR regulator
MSIGTFSRASLLSVVALRKYHEAGILVPADVNARTGYRGYHPSQLIDAAIIRRLRRLDVSLGDIRTILRARDPGVTSRVLARHEARMRESLREIETIVGALSDGRDDPLVHTPVQVRALPAAHTLAVRGIAREVDYGAFLGRAYPALLAAVAEVGAVPAGPPAALYPAEIPDDGPQEIEAYVPLTRPVAPPDERSGVVAGEIPAAHVAVLVHAGPYDTISDSYRHLGAWVARHAEPVPRPVREVYVVSFSETDDPERFRTEIHWPVRPANDENREFT